MAWNPYTLAVTRTDQQWPRKKDEKIPWIKTSLYRLMFVSSCQPHRLIHIRPAPVKYWFVFPLDIPCRACQPFLGSCVCNKPRQAHSYFYLCNLFSLGRLMFHIFWRLAMHQISELKVFNVQFRFRFLNPNCYNKIWIQISESKMLLWEFGFRYLNPNCSNTILDSDIWIQNASLGIWIQISEPKFFQYQLFPEVLIYV